VERGLLRADLNLLKVLYVLLEERNVTRAAERLFVTQSAISRSLNRLRQLFDDPLLVRSSHGLIPTERARHLAVVVGDTIERINGFLKPPPFDPRLAHGTVRIAAPESFVLGSMSRLTLGVKGAAPGLCIECIHLPDDYLALLEAGSLDFAINHGQPYPETFLTTALMSMTPLFWFRKDHPLREKREITVKDIVSYPIISFHQQNVSREGHRLIMNAIQDAGLPPPRVILDTSHLLVTLEMLMMSDSIMLGAEHLSRVPAFADNLVARPMANLATYGRGQTTLSLLQHERTARSPLHMWMVEQIREAFAPAPP
jgi:DNA-binding transcriptional LysR family regulator